MFKFDKRFFSLSKLFKPIFNHRIVFLFCQSPATSLNNFVPRFFFCFVLIWFLFYQMEFRRIFFPHPCLFAASLWHVDFTVKLISIRWIIDWFYYEPYYVLYTKHDEWHLKREKVEWNCRTNLNIFFANVIWFHFILPRIFICFLSGKHSKQNFLIHLSP